MTSPCRAVWCINCWTGTTTSTIAACAPDVVFLDVKMPVASGLEVARAWGAEPGPLVVFVTAYDHFALPAFETAAVDYLTKPLTEARFDAALARVRERLRLFRTVREGDPSASDASVLVQPTYLSHLVSHVANRDVIVPLDSVDHIEAADVYALVFAEGRRHLVRTALDTLEQELDPALCVRVHRSYIIRVSRVREVHRASSTTLVLDTGVTIPVSRRRRAVLSAALKQRFS